MSDTDVRTYKNNDIGNSYVGIKAYSAIISTEMCIPMWFSTVSLFLITAQSILKSEAQFFVFIIL